MKKNLSKSDIIFNDIILHGRDHIERLEYASVLIEKLQLDNLDDSLNSNSRLDADEDDWLPEDIYGNNTP